MEIEFSLTVEDLQAFVNHRQKQASQTRNRFRPYTSSLPWIIAIILIMAFMFEFTSQGALFLVLFLSGGVCGATAVFFLFVWFVWIGKVAVKSAQDLSTDEHSRWLFLPRRLTISPEIITNTDAYEQVSVRWAVVWKIAVTEDHAFLYTTADAAQIVPRRAFRDQQHFEAFLALARQYQQQREQQTPKSTGVIAGLPPQSDAFTRPDLS